MDSLRLSKKPRVKIIPGRPEVKPRQAYCETSRRVIGYTPGGGYWREGESNPAPLYEWQMSSSYGTVHGTVHKTPARVWVVDPSIKRQPIYQETTHCYPAIIGVKAEPTRFEKSYTNSWQDGAQSINQLVAESFFTVKLPPTAVAIMIGVGSSGVPYGFSQLRSAVVVRPGTVTAISNGVEGLVENISSRHLHIIRTGDKVKYFINGTFFSESTIPEAEELHIYAMLYAGSDYVEMPRLGDMRVENGAAQMSMQVELDPTPRGISMFRIQSFGGMYHTGSTTFRIEAGGDPISTYTIKAVASQSEAVGYVASTAYGEASAAIGSIAATGLASDSDGAIGRGQWPSYLLDASSVRAERQPEKAEGFWPVGKLYGYIISGGVMSGDGAATAMGKASDNEWFGGKIEVKQLVVIDGQYDRLPQGQLEIGGLIDAGFDFAFDAAAIFTFIDGVDIGDTLDVYVFIDMVFGEAVEIEDSITFGGMIELLIQEGVIVSPYSSIARQEPLQYAVNAVTGALSRYQNFGFKQFATVDGVTYGLAGDGVYELAGDTDNGDPLSAAIDFGASDYGTAQGKRMSSVYAGVATDGQVYIRVAGDHGTEAVYRATSYGHESRATTAKGAIARHWRLKLDLVDASYADIDNVEVEIGVSQRRLGRRR